jgi:hypothetical protein
VDASVVLHWTQRFNLLKDLLPATDTRKMFSKHLIQNALLPLYAFRFAEQ